MFTGDVIDSDDLTGFDEAWDNFDVLLEETNDKMSISSRRY